MYDLTVAEVHSFFVGEGGWWVHNCGGRLTWIGNGQWRSSAGLIYGPGSPQGNRVRHILEHAAPDPTKASHTVFNVPRNDVLGLVDEAWSVRGSALPNDPGAFIVQMGREVGTQGENAIKIIVIPGTSEIISAYPVMR